MAYSIQLYSNLIRPKWHRYIHAQTVLKEYSNLIGREIVWSINSVLSFQSANNFHLQTISRPDDVHLWFDFGHNVFIWKRHSTCRLTTPGHDVVHLWFEILSNHRRSTITFMIE